MIISASRRTDIPAFYSEWLMNRLKAGFCHVPNPFNRQSVSRVSLRAEDVDAMVFWTRWPKPLMARLDELARTVPRFYFLYTLLGYPREIDPGSPEISRSVEVFRELAGRISPERVIWRYDPIVLSPTTDAIYHVRQVERIAKSLAGSTHKVIFSFRDAYRKAEGRVALLRGTEMEFRKEGPDEAEAVIERLGEVARAYGIEPSTCAEERNYSEMGVPPGRCVDGRRLQAIWGEAFTEKKDTGQREACGCVQSRDIGMYDACTFGCLYCYATTSFELARINRQQHNPASPSLVGWLEATTAASKKCQDGEPSSCQLSLLGSPGAIQRASGCGYHG